MEKTVKEMQVHMTQMMNEAIATNVMRAEAKIRAKAMLQTLLERMSGSILGRVASKSETVDKQRQKTTPKVRTQTQDVPQIPQVAKQT